MPLEGADGIGQPPRQRVTIDDRDGTGSQPHLDDIPFDLHTDDGPLDEWEVWRLMDDVGAVLEATGGLEPWEIGQRDVQAAPDGVLLARTVLARRWSRQEWAQVQGCGVSR